MRGCSRDRRHAALFWPWPKRKPADLEKPNRPVEQLSVSVSDCAPRRARTEKGIQSGWEQRPDNQNRESVRSAFSGGVGATTEKIREACLPGGVGTTTGYSEIKRVSASWVGSPSRYCDTIVRQRIELK